MSRHAQGLEPRRLLSAGGLDANFGNAGVATANVGDGQFTVIDWGVTPSGKVVALGKLSPGQGGTRYSLTRFNADGTVDDSFAGEKTINGHPRGIDTVEHMAVLPDGRLIF